MRYGDSVDFWLVFSIGAAVGILLGILAAEVMIGHGVPTDPCTFHVHSLEGGGK